MALAKVAYVTDGVARSFPFTFPYLDPSHIIVTLGTTATTAFTIQGGSVVFAVAPTAAQNLTIRRVTPSVSKMITFHDASTLTAPDLETSATQLFYLEQEALDNAAASLYVGTDGTVDAATVRIRNVGTPVASGDAVNKSYVDPILASATAQATASAASAASAAASQTATAALANSAAVSASAAAIAGAKDTAAISLLLHPSVDASWRDVYRAGFLPFGLTQQIGGSQWGGLPDGSNGDVATCQIQDDGSLSVGAGAGFVSGFAPIVVGQSGVHDAIYLKLAKTGNPTSATVRIYTDASGKPGTAIGTLVTLNAKQLTSKADGEYYSVIGLAAPLTAGVVYHVVLTVPLDAANYVSWKRTAVGRYPYGYSGYGDATPTWTIQTGASLCFILPNPTANAFLQPGGQFDGKIVFGGVAGQASQYKMLNANMGYFHDGKNFTLLMRMTGLTINTVIADFLYGIDHERLQVAINASGFLVVTFYHETGIAGTVTGTTNVTTAGLKDIAIGMKTEGAGADFLKVWLNGAAEGTPLTAQTWALSNDLRDLGNAIIGGGFPVAPAWTLSANMSVLPSLSGFTYGGTTTEASAFSVSGGKLYMTSSGYASTQTGFYAATTTLNNATGWTVVWKGRLPFSPNVSQDGCTVAVNDGTRTIGAVLNEYFLQVFSTGVGYVATAQGDFKTQEHVFVLQGQGTSFYLFMDGRLVIDGTGLMTGTTAANNVTFGDTSATAGVNSDWIIDYFNVYAVGMLMPVPASGASLHELGYWSVDKSALLPFAYNAGAPVSLKQLCGVEKNYIEGSNAGTQTLLRKAVTSGPTTTATTSTTQPDLEGYVIGAQIEAIGMDSAQVTTVGNNMEYGIVVDGKNIPYGAMCNTAGFYQDIAVIGYSQVPLGLHKVAQCWRIGAQTGLSWGQSRTLSIKAKV